MRTGYMAEGVESECGNETIRELKGNRGQVFYTLEVGKAFLILTEYPEGIRGKINTFQRI